MAEVKTERERNSADGPGKKPIKEEQKCQNLFPLKRFKTDFLNSLSAKWAQDLPTY